MNNARGFTLLELMIVVAVIGILSAIGIPAYGDYVVRGKLVDATSQLASGRVQLEQFFQDNRVYDNSTGGTPPCPANSKYFTFNCTSGTSTYTLTAASQANQGLGAAGDYSFTINQNNARATTKFAGTATAAACWYMKKGDSC